MRISKLIPTGMYDTNKHRLSMERAYLRYLFKPWLVNDMWRLNISLMMSLILSAVVVPSIKAQPILKHAEKVDRNTVYGMYSGLALLMDVYFPSNPNGYGIVQISGSGWNRPLKYDATMLNHQPHVRSEAEPLLQAGYTIFSLNHRASPRFQYPAQVADVQRAVRYIRFHAKRYGIHADQIGAIGGSSGGHLVSMLGLLNGDENRPDQDPVNRVDAKVQCVIACETPSDFLEYDGGDHFLGVRLKERQRPHTIEYHIALDASPVSHISPDDPPMLLVHGDADEDVPFSLSESMFQKLQDKGVKTQLIRVRGGQHAFQFFDKKPADLDETYVKWMNRHLQKNRN